MVTRNVKVIRTDLEYGLKFVVTVICYRLNKTSVRTSLCIGQTSRDRFWIHDWSLFNVF